jgi:hypothetical protein
MTDMEFHVCWNRADANWLVRLGDEHYGAYLTKEEALLDAFDAAGEAQTKGIDAHVRDATAGDYTSENPQRLRELAMWYREFAEKVGSPAIWDARLQTAEDLDDEVGRIERVSRLNAPPEQVSEDLPR